MLDLADQIGEGLCRRNVQTLQGPCNALIEHVLEFLEAERIQRRGRQGLVACRAACLTARVAASVPAPIPYMAQSQQRFEYAALPRHDFTMRIRECLDARGEDVLRDARRCGCVAADFERGRQEARRRIAGQAVRAQRELMSIPVNGDIGLEKHPDTDQFIRLDRGRGRAQRDPARTN